jgi:hypothetical protein
VNVSQLEELSRTIRVSNRPLSAKQMETERKVCGYTFEKFIIELNAGTPMGFERNFISSSQSKGEVIGRMFAPRGYSNSFFISLQNDIREAGEKGDWKTAVLYATWQAQFASVLGFNFVIDAKKRTERRLATNRKTRRSNERVRLGDRNEKILRAWRAHNGHSVRAFWLWMKKTRYSQLTDKQGTDRDLKFAKQLKPRGKFLKYDVFRTLITRKIRVQKKKIIIS